ncbi:MAG: hypothetical protein FWC80_02535 [Firmicutes bacterium]|nr:hypothetical protein [Bacillota bacterium]
MNKAKKQRRYPTQRVYTIKEGYAGTKKLTDIFIDLLYSVYKKEQEIPLYTNTDHKAS